MHNVLTNDAPLSSEPAADRSEQIARYRREGEGPWFWALPDAEALAICREAKAFDDAYTDDGLSHEPPEDLYSGWCEGCGQHSRDLRRDARERLCPSCFLDAEVDE